jgi:parallel beta-helix repeat protein
MNKTYSKKVAVALTFLCLMALCTVCSGTVKAQYQGNITINSDGSFSPTSAPIQQTGNTYLFTCDINGSITVYRSNIVIDGNKHTISPNFLFGSGITLMDTTNSTVTNFSVIGGQFGINVDGTFNVVSSNIISSVNNGIYSLDEPTGGIALTGTSNSILQNSFQNNLVGINFFGDSPTLNCSYNLIVGNTFTNCSTALLFYDSSSNTFYHNNFINNEHNFYDSGSGVYPQVISINTWDNGYPSGGNYWGHQAGKEIDNTGISNTPFTINSQNVDHYPLTEPFTVSFLLNYEQEITPPIISVLSPLKQIYSTSNVSLAFSINKPVSWMGFSLDGKQNVTITGNSTIANMTNGVHSVTFYANDTFGNMSHSEITFTIAVPNSFPIAFVAAVFVIATVAIIACLLVYHKRKAK